MIFFKVLFAWCLFCVINNVYAQNGYCPPANIGFENGTLENWACDTGGINLNGIVQVIPTEMPIGTRQTLINAYDVPALDQFGNFPILCPYGAKYSIKLGNEQVGARAERISYDFTIPAGADQYTLIFYYAVVLQNPKHLPFQQPRFTVKTYDLSDNSYIECASFDFVASSNLPGFKLAPSLTIKDTAIYYKDWSPSTINLRNLAGKKIRLEFTTNDCSEGAHFGYAYIDVNENCGSPVTGNSFCTGQKSVTMVAPGGFGQYAWFKGDLSEKVGSGQSLSISPPPPDQTKYAVITYPYYGLGCSDTLYTTVSSVNSGFTFTAKDTIRVCSGSTVDLTAPAVTQGSTPNLELSYFTDALGTLYLYKPQNITSSGTYYIKAVSPQGCINVLPVVVVINTPRAKVTNPQPVTYPKTIDISATFTHQQGVSYGYYADLSAPPISNYTTVARSGTYYIKATNSTGCDSISPVVVVVNPPPPPVIQAVNTFTPNNDGVNDYFNVTVIGYGVFESLRIYNRYGQLVFQTKSPVVTWDGKLNGKPLNTGTYYWVFTGLNTYYNSRVVQGGYVELIR